MTEGFKVEDIQQAFISDPSVEAQRGQRAQLWLDIHSGGRWAGLPALGEARASGKEATAKGDKGQGLNHHFTINSLCGLTRFLLSSASVSTAIVEGWAWGPQGLFPW